MKLISEIQTTMNKIAVHLILKKIKERKNERIISSLMKKKWERMMQKEYWWIKHHHRIYFIKVEECKIMKTITKIDQKKELHLKWWCNKIIMFIIIHNQWILTEIMGLTIVTLRQLQCPQLLIKKYFNNIEILLTLNLTIKAIENWDQPKKVWILEIIYLSLRSQEKCYLQTNQKIKCYLQNVWSKED